MEEAVSLDEPKTLAIYGQAVVCMATPDDEAMLAEIKAGFEKLAERPQALARIEPRARKSNEASLRR